MTNFLSLLHNIVWGIPALVLILGVGLYISIQTRFVQIRLFPVAIRQLLRAFCRQEPNGGVSAFQALCTALAATVGTGNIIGVAGALCLGGPGAIFWMWICALLGMGTKFAEVTLALHYRIPSGKEFLGGPMYMIIRGMGEKWKPLAVVYAAFGIIASFGVGNATQINAIICGINGVLNQFHIESSDVRNLGFGLLLAIAVGAALLGGAARIGRIAEGLVPFASAGYILLCVMILILRREYLCTAFSQILRYAFSPKALSGGILGSMLIPLRVGCARGVFTNEAGMGTASMAHSSAQAAHPVQQGLLGIVEVFLDTIVICTLTALVILVSGVSIPYGVDAGGTLTGNALTNVLGNWVSLFLAGALACFAFATVLGWGLYGARCAQFLFGSNAWIGFAVLQTAAVILGSVANTEGLWLFAELINGAMAIPNLIALAALTPVLRRLTIEYERKPGTQMPVEVPNADFHQRKPL